MEARTGRVGQANINFVAPLAHPLFMNSDEGTRSQTRLGLVLSHEEVAASQLSELLASRS